MNPKAPPSVLSSQCRPEEENLVVQPLEKVVEALARDSRTHQMILEHTSI